MKLGNIKKVLKPHIMIPQRPVPPATMKTPANTSKNLLKTEIKLFAQCTISREI